MFIEKDHLSFECIGVQPPRCYYIPFAKDEKIPIKRKIIDRNASSRFISLDGEWDFGHYDNIEEIDIKQKLSEKISVPSCVQLFGYDKIQYINERYPFFYDPPNIPTDTPVFHYRREFRIDDLNYKYYLNFEGVDSGYYVYINKQKIGFGQMSHCTNEFDITPYIIKGNNTLDVIVLKWCAGSYLECQDKFRFSGIFRRVYILKRPCIHITDYTIKTYIQGNDGVIEIYNNGATAFDYEFKGKRGHVEGNNSSVICIPDAHIWTDKTPYLYNIVFICGDEKILNRIGIRTVYIHDGIFYLNNKHIKLKGINRHEFSCITGATVCIEQTIKDIKLIKRANANAVRTAHYPNIPEFYDLCDALGLYVVDEADVEAHGIFNTEHTLGYKIWEEENNRGIYDKAVYNRLVALLERDKNRTCVIVWSIGNESGFGKMFYDGIQYIKEKDSRPIHYQGIVAIKGQEDFYTDKIDILGVFYPNYDFFEEFLADEKEKRPLLLTEYLHAMGNSCGGAKEYWDKINSSDRIIGGFVWEFNDHAIKTDKGFLYGGDFGEKEHDGNFCVDGLLDPERKIKSNYLEIQSMYAEFREEKKDISKCCLESNMAESCPIRLEIDKRGQLLSTSLFSFVRPMSVNIMRAYTDNDFKMRPEWDYYKNFLMQNYVKKEIGHNIIYQGKIVVNTLKPIMEYELIYKPFNEGLDIIFKYQVADFVTYLPRVGLEFAIDKKHKSFSYLGYGETESYIDKHLCSKYGRHCSTVNKNFSNYIKPQECGSHYGSTELAFADFIKITAQTPFSFSVLPYSTRDLSNAAHNFELGKSDAVYINLDIAMSGIGTASCGPELPFEYRAPKAAENTFRICYCTKKNNQK